MPPFYYAERAGTGRGCDTGFFSRYRPCGSPVESREYRRCQRARGPPTGGGLTVNATLTVDNHYGLYYGAAGRQQPDLRRPQ